MGVMGCYRNGCGKPMCDTYIPTIGYVCIECQEEFLDFVKGRNLDLTEAVIVENLKVFMTTLKGNLFKHVEPEEFLRRYTVNRFNS